MPSPVGHALAGTIVAIAATPKGQRPSAGVVLLCGFLACAPDLDLLLATHRTATHSLIAIVGVFGAVWVSRRRHTDRLRLAGTCAAAYASHIVLDLMGVDWGIPAGLQLFWPWVDVWYQTPWPLFLGTERRTPFEWQAILVNLKALVWELLVLLPVLTWTIRRRQRPAG